MFIPTSNNRFILKENNKYESSKENFVNIIQGHFKRNIIIIDEVTEGLPIAGELKEAKVAEDINEIPDEIIDKVIDRYVNVVFLFLGIAPPLSIKVKKEIELIIGTLTDYKNVHTNKKGKAWRGKLYELGKVEYQQNNILDKTKALKAAFEKIPNKELHREEFDRYFKSIYEKFIKLL